MRVFPFLLLSFICINYSCAEATSSPEEKPEKQAVTALDTMSLDDLAIYGSFEEMEHIFAQENDTTYIINFWATWCKPCVAELPYFEDLHKKYADKKIKVILVSLDFPNKLETKLVPFINENELQSEVVVLTDGRYNNWIDKVDIEWGGAIPVTVVYKGKNREFIGRAFEDSNELSELVSTFL